MRRLVIGHVVATAGAALTLVGTFVAWLRSGTRHRNSYEIFALVERLGISRSSVVGWALRLWPIVPFVLVLAVSMLWLAPRAIAVSVAAATVIYTGAVSIAVLRSPSHHPLITIEVGPIVTLFGVGVLAVGTAISAFG